MKSFLLFLLGIMLVITVSMSLQCNYGQQMLLKEIINSVNLHRKKMSHKNSDILLKEVIKPSSCEDENFCKAGRVLSELKAEVLISNETQYLLRRLSAYTKNISCYDDNSTSAIEVSFYHLLTNIKLCAQKHYRESCGTHKKH